ncbi:MAG: hypothetical protein IIA33_10975 [Planctomycetes bacterium]|nr:hypothetical protein [Planctomycetota bacterium]
MNFELEILEVLLLPENFRYIQRAVAAFNFDAADFVGCIPKDEFDVAPRVQSGSAASLDPNALPSCTDRVSCP